MTNRICLITGGTSGVGKATALGLAQLGATVVIVSRDKIKGTGIVQELISKTNNTNIDYLTADLSEPESVLNLAAEFKSRYQALHLLSNNAAILPMRRTTNSRGVETIFAVNYLSHFLLTNLILDLLLKSAPSRIMTVTGNIGIIRFGKINFNDLQLEHTFNPLKATLQAVFAKEIYFLSLAKKLEGTGVTTNTFSPGLVKSQLGRNAPVFLRPFIHAAMAFLPNHCKQAVFLASDKSIEKMTGMHYENGRAMEFKHRYFTSENFQKLNEASEKLSYS